MVFGRTARVTQETCIFCAFHVNYSILRTSRRIHFSQRNHRSTEATATQQAQDSRSTELFTSRNSKRGNVSKQASDVDRNQGAVYGARYTERAPPSWSRKDVGNISKSPLGQASAPSQEDTVNQVRLVSSSTLDRVNENSTSSANVRSREFRIRYVNKTVDLSLSQRQNETDQPPLNSRNEQRGGDYRAKRSTTNSPRPETGAVDANRGSNSSVTQNDSNPLAFRRFRPQQDFSNASIKDEFQNILAKDSSQDVLINRRSSGTPGENSKAAGEATTAHSGQGAQHMPKWTQLNVRAKPSAEMYTLSKLDSETVAPDRSFTRFKPLGRSVDRRKRQDFFEDEEVIEKVKGSSISPPLLRQPLQILENTDRNEDSVGPIQSSTLIQKPILNVSSEDNTKPSRSKDGRRRVPWEEEKDEGEGRRSKPKKANFSKRRNENDAEDDLDPEKIERIEEKQRRKAAKKVAREDRASGQSFIVPSFISIGNLATALKIRAESFSEVLRGQGFSHMSNDHVLDAETAGLIASELGFKAILPTRDSEIDIVPLPPPESTDLLPPRPPVVTIMGHVDHGKTTLLDWLRKSSIAASEHGGITQHIGAFTVQMPSGRIITFLDTPGHAAFLEMRARGANVTDIVILVVAADDSVKPQTIEAIKHAKAAHTQIVVAVSKIDKPEADADRVKQDLARHGIEVEDFGGDTQTVCVSGKTGVGMDKLEDAIIALADVLDVKADPTGPVEGWVLEGARALSGKVATVLIRRGTIKPGQVIVAGQTWARVRNLRNEAGESIEEGLPGTPVEIDGWNQQPEAGAEVLQAPNEQRARRVVDYRIGRAQIEKQAADVTAVNEARKLHDQQRAKEKAIRKTTLKKAAPQQSVEDQKPSEPGFTEVPIIIRADVSGSVEAVHASILALGNSEVRVNVVHTAVGSIGKSDIDRAVASHGCIVNFNTALDGEIIRLAERAGVRIIDGNIIYKVVDDVKAVLEEKLAPRITHHVTGEADVLQVFQISLKGKKTLPVAGCRVRNGIITKGSKVKVVRKEEVVYEGLLSTLKNLKKDVTEMRKGSECGLSFDEYDDFAPGDQIQCYEVKSEKRYL